jgi:magnesium-transporting ATPase (P-type)
MSRKLVHLTSNGTARLSLSFGSELTFGEKRVMQRNDVTFMCCRRLVYGSNEISVPIQTVVTLLFLEVLNPFYVFQLFSFCLWFADNYMYYALAILAMSVFGIVMAVIQTRKVSEFLTPSWCQVDCTHLRVG